MKKSTLVATLLLSSIPLLGMGDINTFVEKAYKKNYELKSLEASLEVAKQQISVASNLNNPTLTFGATDVWLSDISNRDSEPMQAYYLGISQNIPLTKKLTTKKEIAKNDFIISKYNLEDKKLKFKSNITLYLYNIALLQDRIVLFTKLEENLQKLENLLKELYKYNKASQTEILNIQVLQNDIKVKKVELYNLLQIQTLNLEKISYSKYENVKLDLELKPIQLEDNYLNHPKILNLQEEIKKFENIAKFEKQKKNSDIKVSLTYFNRDEKYEDYLNIGFAMPLSVYGTEEINSRKAQFKTIELKNKLEDLKFDFSNKLKVLQSDIDSSLKTYKIIKNSVLPKLTQLQKTLENYNSFSKVNSTALIKNLNQIIEYEIKAINEKQKYFTSLANSTYFYKENK